MTEPPFAALLRRELEEHVIALGTRRRVPPAVYVGVPGLERVQVADSAGGVGWRADLVQRAVEGVEEPRCAWVRRSGALEPTDDDHAWCAAARLGFATHGHELPAFYVFTRAGWLELLSGDLVTFHRIRRR